MWREELFLGQVQRPSQAWQKQKDTFTRFNVTGYRAKKKNKSTAPQPVVKLFKYNFSYEMHNVTSFTVSLFIS